MPRSWLASALILTACAGGQTGEITELGACSEPVGTVLVSEPSQAGRSARDQLAAITTSAETELQWEGSTAPSTLEVGFVVAGERATLLGGSECEQPWLEVPVTLALRTTDGALDENIAGTALLTESDVAAVRAELSLAELRGTVELDDALDRERAILRVDLSADAEAMDGQISIDPGTEGADDRALASF